MDLRPTVFFLFWTSLSLQLKDLTGHKVYTNTWAVHVPGGPAVADRISKKYGFINHGQIFGDYYHFHHRAVVKRSLSPHRTRHVQLSRDPQVHWVEQQVAKKRRKRDIFTEPTDPKFPLQWYLYDVNRHDLHVKEAWAQGYTGKGVVVSILDDGIEKNHPDLQENYDPAASYDVNDQDPDPQPRYTQLNDNSFPVTGMDYEMLSPESTICYTENQSYSSSVRGVKNGTQKTKMAWSFKGLK